MGAMFALLEVLAAYEEGFVGVEATSILSFLLLVAIWLGANDVVYHLCDLDKEGDKK